jgi:CelD/BcsL family acetyltransferase involved in cellulose biosynthesis
MSAKGVSARFHIQMTESFEEAEPVWRALETTGDATVFQTYDWQATWYRIIGQRQHIRPYIAIVRTEHDDPIMLLPLGFVRRGFARALIWLGGDLTDYNGPVLAAGAGNDLDRLDIEALWRSLRRELPRFDYVDFRRQPARIADQPNPLMQLSNRTNPISGCYTELGPCWASYHSGKRSAETRRKERRKEAKLAQNGPPKFVVAQTPAEIDEIIRALFAQKTASYRRKGVKNHLRNPTYVDFVKAFTHAFAESGQAVLAAITVHDEIIATQWGLLHGNRFYCLAHSHDQGRFARYSPGNILLRRLMEWCCERQVAIFDFTYGEESYKNHWCEGRLQLHDSLLPITFLGRLLVLRVRFGEGISDIVKRSSRLYALADGLRKLWYGAVPAPRATTKSTPHRSAAAATQEGEVTIRKRWNRA